MALPQIGDGEQLGDGNVNERLNVGKSTQPVCVGPASTSLVGFFGTTPVTKPANTLTTTALASLTTTTVCAMTTTQLATLQTTVNSICATLSTLGLNS